MHTVQPPRFFILYIASYIQLHTSTSYAPGTDRQKSLRQNSSKISLTTYRYHHHKNTMYRYHHHKNNKLYIPRNKTYLYRKQIKKVIRNVKNSFGGRIIEFDFEKNSAQNQKVEAFMALRYSIQTLELELNCIISLFFY